MSKFNYILGSDSITVFVDGQSYTINKQAHTYELVLAAVRDENLTALRNAVNIRQGVVAALTESAASGKVRIEDDAIFYGDREVTGLISGRIFEMLRLGLSVKPMVRFLENMMANPSKRAVDETFGFIDACHLPITEDGHFLAYKRVRADYLDVYTGTMDNSVGNVLSMERNLVDEDKYRTCSAGLHFCSYAYLSSFSGDRIMTLKINPRDVVAIPSDYNNSKGRTCRYEVVSELPLDQYKMPERVIKEDYTDEFSGSTDTFDNEDDNEESWDESSDDNEESWDESSDEPTVEEEIENLLDDEIDNIVEVVKDGVYSLDDIAYNHGISYDALLEIIRQRRVTYGSAKAPVKKAPVSVANTTGKLSPADVKAIRRQLGKGESLAQIARQYDVHPRSIARVRDGEAWSNV